MVSSKHNYTNVFMANKEMTVEYLQLKIILFHKQ